MARVWKGIKRTKGEKPAAKRAILGAVLRRMIEELPATAIGIRNRAILLVGYYGAFRRAELVALDWEDLQESAQGIIVTVRRSKTDQTAFGAMKALPVTGDAIICPVRALRAWIELATITSGPLFRRIRKGEPVTGDCLSPDAVAVIVKAAARRLGFEAEEFAGHSLRSRFATQGAMDGAADREIMLQIGHRSRQMVDRYVRVVTIWQGNAITKLKI